MVFIVEIDDGDMPWFSEFDSYEDALAFVENCKNTKTYEKSWCISLLLKQGEF